MKHYYITEVGDERKPMMEQNSIQFTQSVDEKNVVATIEIAKGIEAGAKIVGVKIRFEELKNAL